ncbi:hypothetical protein LTR53_002401 [Teratosphaeriaceae sp. CCFEE 6253]|nr:hypothetical protein LTR53_002401 [Teratosphaeriaceae sp. CCFEE 6253]
MDPQSESPLLKLPPELRNRIYHEALVELNVIQVQATRCDPANWQPPGLLQTCRLVRAEASKMYYTNNAFWVDVQGEVQSDIAPVLPWLRALDANARDALRGVQLLVYVVYVPLTQDLYLGWDSRSRSHDYPSNCAQRLGRYIGDIETAEGLPAPETLRVQCRSHMYMDGYPRQGQDDFLDWEDDSDFDIKSMKRGLMRGLCPSARDDMKPVAPGAQ